MSPVIYKSVGALGLGRFSDRTQHSESDRTRRACVRSQVTYADIGRETWSAEAKAGLDTGLSQVTFYPSIQSFTRQRPSEPNFIL